MIRLLLGLTLTTAASAAPQSINTPDDARSHGLESLRVAILNDGGVPLPPNLSDVVRDKHAALVLGKALFWDMSVGSDGIQACASCHFHAGADNRVKNQLNPALDRVENDRQDDVSGWFNAGEAPDDVFHTRQVNETLVRDDFPFVRDIGSGNNVVETGGIVDPAPGNSNDIASSQGVELREFLSTTPGGVVDAGADQDDVVFNENGHNVRRVAGRNSPTMINAALNFHNFWDGRANNTFNGVDPFGNQSPGRVFKSTSFGGLTTETLRMKNGSLASQAVGPPLSSFEMSWDGRNWRDVGRKMLPRRALSLQPVAFDDSALGPFVHSSGIGLNFRYLTMVQAAFHTEYWSASQDIYYPPGGGAPVFVTPGTTPAADTFTIAEANFALYFGIAIMMYEATLISDETPFDKWMEGNGSAVVGFGPSELRGLNVFADQGKCINCHGGPELTNASVRNAQRGRNMIEPMLMANLRPALYDNGYYNIGVTPTVDDLARGLADPWDRPLAHSRQLLFDNLAIMNIPFDITGDPICDLASSPFGNTLGFIDEDSGAFFAICNDMDGDGCCGEGDKFRLERVAVDGAFKTPGLRNVELTGPFFHNGGVATLREVVDFYDRGGNFCRFNYDDLDPDIRYLGLSEDEKRHLVDFMLSLTDQRVKLKQAPFDHPGIRIPHGHQPGGATIFFSLQAVGQNGVPDVLALQPFLNENQHTANEVRGHCSTDDSSFSLDD